MQKTQVWSLGWENALEKEMAIHSSTIAWETPWTEEPGRLVHGVAESDTTERLHSHFHSQLTMLWVSGEGWKGSVVWLDV